MFGDVSRYQIGKKESVFDDFKSLEKRTAMFIQQLRRYPIKPETLVFFNNIYNNFIKHPRWKDLDKLVKIFLIFQYGQENGFYALTADFSHEFCQKLQKQNNPEDFIRRRLNANFKDILGFIPQYSFILEDLSKNGHLHGIIQPNLNKEKLKQVLKRTFLGKNYRKSAINNHCVKIKPMWDAGGWLAYIFKRYLSMPQEVKFYLNQKLQKVVNYRYNILRRGENDCYRLYSC